MPSKRGRPAKPVARHKMEGTYRPARHAQRPKAEDVSPPHAPKPEPPEYLDDETKAAFDQIATHLASSGIGLTIADSYMVECAAVALVHARRAQRTLTALGSAYYESRYGVSLHPATRQLRASWDAFMKASAVLGLSVADRERIKAGQIAAEGDPLASLHELRAPLRVVGGEE